ncbi:MAG: hypothetical protein Pg6C_09670 [Treponemataceae bacterium]|nr:MAG: hypothetical protein Pg6C_09670 [Treponemataceae bacterium]
MRYEETEKLTEGQFLRLAGVKRAVFGKCLPYCMPRTP